MDKFVTLYTLAVTIGIYLWSVHLSKKYSSPLTNPVFLSTLLIIFILVLSHIPYAEYQGTKEVLTFFLGPATVGIAVPLYQQRKVLYQNLIPSFAGILVGSVVCMLTTILTLKGLHLSSEVVRSMSVKTITTPIAMEVAGIIHGDKVLAAIFVVLTGMLGAMTGPSIMNRMKIYHPLSRGLALGTQAHGIGTARAASEGELQVAIAGVAMGVNGIFVSILVPSIVVWMIN
ncbi:MULTISPECIES: LrgB family protein [Aneurinibacillus]|jgi:predicted murein hydrolase (TIGR00659 family)|uniref:CidB/LrgB family autolysis modulator n=1 Tax=Aneurinibacillus danicus TaxID=267746 RepID=A0A511V9C1_9BACL|nr:MULTISPECIES: LrgB family protein [Aneurinibacillus]GEN35517.1 CidB/LrgB family autolysis modulator [Aneurinibacillus danicus]